MASEIHRNALKPGFRVHWYQIERILGQGGFGITYLADDTNLNQKVALKEYLPVEVAVREGDFSVHPVSRNHDDSFRWGLDRFLEEARTLARFDHPNIVRVLSVFEMNNTAYMVMRYERGKSLQQMLPKRATIDEERLGAMLFPVMDGLQRVHEAGFIHRDIKPANIFIRDDGSPVLLDFGSARQSLGAATRTLTTLVSPGYAPFEQYYSKSDKQGPWTDIYGLGATLYRAIVGVAPMNAVDRSEGLLKQGQDPLVAASVAAENRYSPAFLHAVDWSLRFDETERPRSIEQWRNAFEGEEVPAQRGPAAAVSDAITLVRGENDVPTADRDDSRAPTTQPGQARFESAPRLRSRYLFAGMAVMVLLAAGLAVMKSVDRVPPARETATAAVRANPGPESTEAAEPPPVTEPVSDAAAPTVESPPREASPTGDSGAAPARARASIDALLRQAETDIGQLRLSRPPGSNALEKYRRVLELDPDNKEARDGVRKIVEAYTRLAKNAVDHKRYDRAELYLNEALSIAPDSEKLRKAQDKLRRLKRGTD